MTREERALFRARLEDMPFTPDVSDMLDCLDDLDAVEAERQRLWDLAEKRHRSIELYERDVQAIEEALGVDPLIDRRTLPEQVSEILADAEKRATEAAELLQLVHEADCLPHTDNDPKQCLECRVASYAKLAAKGVGDG